jgi:hypothetical protein
MAVAMSLWNFQLYPDDDNISAFFGGTQEEEEETYSDQELNPFDSQIVADNDPDDNPFDVPLEDNPFETEIDLDD